MPGDSASLQVQHLCLKQDLMALHPHPTDARPMFRQSSNNPIKCNDRRRQGIKKQPMAPTWFKRMSAAQDANNRASSLFCLNSRKRLLCMIDSSDISAE